MNRIYFSLAEMTWGRALLFGLVALGLYWAVFYNDGSALKQNYTQSLQQLADAEKLLQATKDAIANADRFEREVKDAVEQFNRVVDFMPERMNTAEMTTVVSELASRSRTRLVRTEPSDLTGKEGFYETTRLSFTLEGAFSEIVMFLSYLSRIPSLMTFDNAELTTLPGADIENPKLAFNANLVGYKYLKAKIVDDPKNPSKAGASPAGQVGEPNAKR